MEPATEIGLLRAQALKDWETITLQANTIASLTAKVEVLEVLVKKLVDQQSRNSTNSNLPPSSDGPGGSSPARSTGTVAHLPLGHASQRLFELAQVFLAHQLVADRSAHSLQEREVPAFATHRAELCGREGPVARHKPEAHLHDAVLSQAALLHIRHLVHAAPMAARSP